MAAADGSEREGSAKSFEKSEGKAKKKRKEEKEEKTQRGNLSGGNPSLCPSTIQILLRAHGITILLETSLTAEAKLVKDEKDSVRKILETKLQVTRGS